jgi:hypothetical protein
MSRITWDFTRAVTVGVFLVALCMLIPNVAQAGCNVFVKTPYAARIVGQRAIVAVGVRGTDCKERKLFHVRLRQDRFLWPDKTLAEVRFMLTNASLRTRYLCKGPIGEKGVFAEAWVEGDEKHQSARVKFKACG